MKMLARSVLAGLVAFCAAWFVLPCEPERSMPVASGTKLVGFSPSGRSVVTFRPHDCRLTVWNVQPWQAKYETKVPWESGPFASASYWTLGLYAFSADDQWLMMTTGAPDDPRLLMVDLASNNELTPISGLALGYWPRPAFSLDGRYVTYTTKDAQGLVYAVLYDIAGRHEQLRVQGAYSLAPPTRQGKWLLHSAGELEYWDVIEKRKVVTIPSWPEQGRLSMTFLTPEEPAVTGLYVTADPALEQQIFFYRYDLATQKFETNTFQSTDQFLTNFDASESAQFLLLVRPAEETKLIEELFDVRTGQVVARYPQPLDMLDPNAFYYARPGSEKYGAGRVYLLDRTGDMAIDSKGQILVSKQISRDNFLWLYFGQALTWLGVRQPPPQLQVQFHSAQTGQLLDRVSLRKPNTKWWDEPLSIHPFEPLLALIDEQGDEARLQFWHVPPRKPWIWIIGCALAVGGFPALVVFGYSKLRKKSSNIATD
jgi:hypothetical protein